MFLFKFSHCTCHVGHVVSQPSLIATTADLERIKERMTERVAFSKRQRETVLFSLL